MHLHKRQTIEQVRLVLDWYDRGLMSRDEVLAKLELKRRRFYQLLKLYRSGKFNKLTPPPKAVTRQIANEVEAAIRKELQAEKQLIANPDMPVKFYNYAAIRDSVVQKTSKRVCAQTVRNRAKAWGYYLPRPASKAKHIRVVLTTATGLLLQHDACHHLWSPYAERKWCLITTIDDYSRLLVYADFWEGKRVPGLI